MRVTWLRARLPLSVRRCLMLLAVLQVLPGAMAGAPPAATLTSRRHKVQPTIMVLESGVATVHARCDSSSSIWVSRKDSRVYVTLTGSMHCEAQLAFTSKAKPRDPPAPIGVTANPSSTVTTSVFVPSSSRLDLLCGGTPSVARCTCVIVKVIPLRPFSAAIARVTTFPARDKVVDPAENVVQPLGAPVVLSCGRRATLWTGKPSDVSVRMTAISTECTPFVTATLERNGQVRYRETDGTAETLVRTFDRVTRIVAECNGKSPSQVPACEFQVTQVTPLPR